MEKHLLFDADIFVTGGAGTLGQAIARRRKEEGWTGKFTVYSTDSHKHGKMKQKYPDVNYVQGDIRNGETLGLAMVGHDVVIHAAAVKVIPDSEKWSIDTYDVNVNGSLNVFQAACYNNVKHVLAISTDKAVHSVNAYGASKYMMEKAAQEYARVPELETQFHLVRYGNVLESNGSVIEFWKKAVAAGEPIKITDPEMTRFWLSPSEAVQLVLWSFDLYTGQVLIPRMPALSIGKLAEYTLALEVTGKVRVERVPMRPGEKMHEELLSIEETEFAKNIVVDDEIKGYILWPTTSVRQDRGVEPYSSDIARELTKEELEELLND